MRSAVVEVETGHRRFTDLTAEVVAFCRGGGDGLVSVFVPHATAGVTLMELGLGSEEDLSALLDRLVPRDGRYRHRHGSPGHGADHLVPVLVGSSVTVPVVSGEPQLGTWQSVVLVDTNEDNHHRTVQLTFLGA